MVEMTFGEFAALWVETSQVSPHELECRRSRYRRYLQPLLGDIPLADLRPHHVERALSAVESPGIRRHVWVDVRAIVRKARAQGLIAHDPLAGVTPPRTPEFRPTIWTDEELRRFVAATREHPRGLLFRVALVTGMRLGELLGLRWRCVDLERGTVTVEADLEWLPGGGWRLGPVKSRSSRRTILLPRDVLEELRDLGPGAPDEFVFQSRVGGPLDPTNVTARDLKAICRAAGVPPIRFHDLRHLHNTLLLRAGVSPRVVAARAGHSSVAFTLQRYSWVTADLQERAAAALEGVISC